jgi:hypothetical protein
MYSKASIVLGTHPITSVDRRESNGMGIAYLKLDSANLVLYAAPPPKSQEKQQ